MNTYERLKEEVERSDGDKQLDFQSNLELRAIAQMLDAEGIEIGSIGIMCAVYGWLVGRANH